MITKVLGILRFLILLSVHRFKILKFLLYLLLSANCVAQNPLVDSATNRVFSSHLVNSTYTALPLMAQGVIYSPYRVNFTSQRDIYLKTFNNNVDTYTQFLPLGTLYAMRSFGIKGRSKSFMQMNASVFTSLAMFWITSDLIKHNVHEKRPEGGGWRAFPSGHTMFAFVGAALLAKEYKEDYPLITIGGYIAAGFTALSRVANKRHWLHDCMFASGLGILDVEFSYALTDLIFNNKYSNNFSLRYIDTKNEKPSYADIFVSYNNILHHTKHYLNDGTKYHFNNGTGLGIETSWFFHPNFGIGIKAGTNTFELEYEGVSSDKNSMMNNYYVEIMPKFSYPILNRVFGAIHFGIGAEHTDAIPLINNKEIKSQNNPLLNFGAEINFWMEKHTFLKFFANYTHTVLSVDVDKHSFPYLQMGSAIAVHF